MLINPNDKKIFLSEIRKGLENEVRDFLPYVKNKCPLFVKKTNLDSDEKICIFLTNIVLRMTGKNNADLVAIFDLIKGKIDDQEKSLRETNSFLIVDKEKAKRANILVKKIEP